MSTEVFMDTNTYLSFYRLSQNDIGEMEKMIHAIQSEELRVLLPSQVIDEYWRNRETVISDTLKKFRDERTPNQYPRLLSGYQELDAIRGLGVELEKKRQSLIEQVEDDARSGSLKADKLVARVFELAEVIEDSGAILKAARWRFDRGNPPGKRGSYGDAIIWESLLAGAEEGGLLYFVSGDTDFSSSLDRGQLSQFLVKEWKEEVGGRIELFSTLGTLFREHYPGIELKIEFEQNRAVDKLSSSRSFAETHRAIGQLDPESNYTPEQIRRIVNAGVTNNQIYAIGEDEDVQAFYDSFLGRHGGVLDDQEWEHFSECFAVEEKD